MCGIAGQLSPGDFRPGTRGFMNIFYHGFPGGGRTKQGQFIDPACALLHRRLSVIDPETAVSP